MNFKGISTIVGSSYIGTVALVVTHTGFVSLAARVLVASWYLFY